MDRKYYLAAVLFTACLPAAALVLYPQICSSPTPVFLERDDVEGFGGRQGSLGTKVQNESSSAARGERGDAASSVGDAAIPPGWTVIPVNVEGSTREVYGHFGFSQEEQKQSIATLTAYEGVSLRANGGKQPSTTVVGRVPPLHETVTAAIRLGEWKTINVGPVVPDRKLIEELESIAAHVILWLTTGRPDALTVSSRSATLDSLPSVPQQFRVQSINMVEKDIRFGSTPDRKTVLFGMDEMDEKEEAWRDYAETFRLQGHPPTGSVFRLPVYAVVHLPIIDGTGSSSEVRITALYCMHQQSWLLLRVEVRPEAPGSMGATSPRFTFDFSSNSPGVGVISDDNGPRIVYP